MAEINGNETLFVELAKQLGKSASFLASRVQDLNSRGQGYASRACQMLAELVQFSTEGVMPSSEADKCTQLLAAAQVLAPLQSNGLGDTVVWPGFRLAQLHRDAEEWTSLTNVLRQLQCQIINPVAPAIKSHRELLLQKVQAHLTVEKNFNLELLARSLLSDTEEIAIGKLFSNGEYLCDINIQADGCFFVKPPVGLEEGVWTVEVTLFGKDYQVSRDSGNAEKWMLTELGEFYEDYRTYMKL